MSFTDLFSFSGPDDESGQQEERRAPPWWGPPEEELGVAVSNGVVLGRSERGVVALSHTLVYSTGVMFEFVALARGLSQSASRLLFHEQHAFDTDELPDGLLRLGLEFAGGRRVSNIGGLAQRRLLTPDAEPEQPVFVPRGGGGGQAGNDRVSMRPGYWLWPLPPAGALKISCEWPVVGIALATIEIDAQKIVDAAAHASPLWEKR